jgi:hypothetical protein
LDSQYIHLHRYRVAFLESNLFGMQEQLFLAMGKPGVEDGQRSYKSDIQAYYGRLREAHVDTTGDRVARRNDSTDAAAIWHANGTLLESEFGEHSIGPKGYGRRIGLQLYADIELGAALAFARNDSRLFPFPFRPPATVCHLKAPFGTACKLS